MRPISRVVSIVAVSTLAGCCAKAPAPSPQVRSTTTRTVGEYYVAGGVDRPGAYSISGRTVTIRQALISAGVDIKQAAGTRVHLVRRGEDNVEDAYDIGAATIFGGDVGDTPMQPDDQLCYGCGAPTRCVTDAPRPIVLP